MSIVNFTSGINNIEQQKPLSEWAAEFIHSNSLSREDFARTDIFRQLSRREKDAIRYQLRKGKGLPKEKKISEYTPTRSRITFRKSPKLNLLKMAKIGLSTWISVFLLFDVVTVYVNKGISLSLAWQAAILVELCFLIASLSRKKSLRVVAGLLLAYNSLIFAFMEANRVSTELRSSNEKAVIIRTKKKEIASAKEKLSEQDEELSRNLKRLSVDHLRGYVTSGATSFEKVSDAISSSRLHLLNEVRELESEIQDAESKLRGSFFVISTSVMYFLLRTLLQLFSLYLLKPENRESRV